MRIFLTCACGATAAFENAHSRAFPPTQQEIASSNATLIEQAEKWRDEHRNHAVMFGSNKKGSTTNG